MTEIFTHLVNEPEAGIYIYICTYKNTYIDMYENT